jgi:MmoB/DmpM family
LRATVTYQPALIRIDGEGKLVFTIDEIREILGKGMTAKIFEVNTSTGYGRIVRVDDSTVTLFGNMKEILVELCLCSTPLNLVTPVLLRDVCMLWRSFNSRESNGSRAGRAL